MGSIPIARSNDINPNRSKNFTYDALNRISTAQTTSTHATGPAYCWGETYQYDGVANGAWGNLTQIAATTNSAYTGCTQESGFSTQATTKNQLVGYCYDAAGNLSLNATCPTGSYTPTYNYNAENQLTSTAGVTYTYDGDGHRVMKSGGIIYWYGMASDQLDETDLTGSFTSSAFHVYIFFGGKRIARRNSANNVNYYFADHLGTARLQIQSGQTNPCYDADFYPFGGERIVTDTCDSAYKFIGKERESESGLDNFGAHYNSSALGRFMSPDWSDDLDPIPYANLGDPQSLNLIHMCVTTRSTRRTTTATSHTISQYPQPDAAFYAASLESSRDRQAQCRPSQQA